MLYDFFHSIPSAPLFLLLLSSYLISTHLILSPLISTPLILSPLISSPLFLSTHLSSHLITSHLISSHLLSTHLLFAPPLLSSPLLSSSLITFIPFLTLHCTVLYYAELSLIRYFYSLLFFPASILCVPQNQLNLFCGPTGEDPKLLNPTMTHGNLDQMVKYHD